MTENDSNDHFGGKTDEEFIAEELEKRRRSTRSIAARWRQHPLNPASDASVRLYRALAILISLTLMVVFLIGLSRGREIGGFAIAASSTAVAFAIAVGARSR